MKSEAIDVAMKVAVDGKDRGPVSGFRAFPCIPPAQLNPLSFNRGGRRVF
jgi:hypothetical protein